MARKPSYFPPLQFQLLPAIPPPTTARPTPLVPPASAAVETCAPSPTLPYPQATPHLGLALPPRAQTHPPPLNPGPDPLRPSLSDLAAASPHIASIRRSLTNPRVATFNNAASLYAAAIRVACASAFLEARAAAAPGADRDRATAAADRASALRAEAAALVAALALVTSARARAQTLAQARSARLSTLLLGVLGPTPASASVHLIPEPPPRRPGALVAFEHSSHMCMAALSAGWDLADALHLWSQVDLGRFSESGRTFLPGPATPQSIPRDWAATEVRHISRSPGEAALSVYISGNQVCAIVSSKPLRIRRTAQGARLQIHDLPSFIALPRDESGRPIIPKSRVTALVEAQLAWHTELGALDALSSTITGGLLVMPKISTPSQRVARRNHPSWEDDPAAQEALGPIIAKWLAQGVLEYVQWDDRRPVLLQPCGAVPKGSAPFYRLITDARFGNTMYSDWGVSYKSAADLSASVHYRDFTWSADLQDAYHLSVFAGCGGALRPCMRPIVQGDGTVSWVDGWVVGCTPSTCTGGCDKDMSGLSINGHIFRFAACQFGQKTAGSPLNALVMSVARYFARLPTPVSIAAWVDDLHFSMRTPPHPPCAGHVGGCVTCTAAYHQAILMEDLWRAKARALNLPLSDGKGHTTAQGGPFTGVMVDTLRGQFLMLAEKLASTRAALLAALAADASTPRLLARCRGKAYHYGCAIPFLARLCPALTQAIHQSESAFDLPAPNLADEAADTHFDWDRPLLVSTRTRAALALLLRVVDECGTSGQPMWPLPAATIFGQFCLSPVPPPPTGPLVLLTTATPLGWGSALRTSLSGPARVCSGTWAQSHGLLSAPWMAGFLPDAAGAPELPAHRHALSMLLALHTASRVARLSDRPLVFRSPSQPAIQALQLGASADPILQDITLLFTSACLDLHIRPPSFLLCHEGAPPTGSHSPPASDALTDSASPHLRRIILATARAACLRITLDLFATHANALCPRFFSAAPESAAEALDAFSQPSWAASFCPICARMRPEFVLLYPPFPLIGSAIRRAQADQAHGIMVVPFATSAAWWYTAMQASRTYPGSRFRRALRLPCTPHLVMHQSNPPGYHLALLHFDFWQGAEPRPRSCLHSHVPRAHLTARCDDWDRMLIHDSITHNTQSP